jgi:hypothetical protein
MHKNNKIKRICSSRTPKDDLKKVHWKLKNVKEEINIVSTI